MPSAPSHGRQSSDTGHGASGVAGGMRRRPIDVNRKLPLVRSQKELAADEAVVADVVSRHPLPLLTHSPASATPQHAAHTNTETSACRGGVAPRRRLRMYGFLVRFYV